jgi:hypothetical protein
MSAALRLLGHNLGLGCDDITIRATAGGRGLVDLPLQEALRRIDEFDEQAQASLLASLPFELQLTGGAS